MKKMIITADLLKKIDSNKIIPVIRQSGTHNVPTFLKTKLYLDFSSFDNYEFVFDKLIRTIHDSPLYEKPEIGNDPFRPVESSRPDMSGDPVKELMKIVVEDFENGGNWTVYGDLVGRVGSSRVMLDKIIIQAKSEGLITIDSGGDLYLADKGKFYAIEHKLVDA